MQDNDAVAKVFSQFFVQVWNAGILIVSACGNQYIPGFSGPTDPGGETIENAYPELLMYQGGAAALHDNYIAVGSVNEAGFVSPFSQFPNNGHPDSDITVFAQGESVDCFVGQNPSDLNDNAHSPAQFTGTSFAAPQVVSFWP